jgi:hypothetical protein
MIYNCKLLLEMALDNGNEQVIELFRLKKDNYALDVGEEIFYESVLLCCRFSHKVMFNYLVHIKDKRAELQSKAKLSMLLLELLEHYDKEKESDKILNELVRMYREVSSAKIVISMPE